jgi:hypothetical protein
LNEKGEEHEKTIFQRISIKSSLALSAGLDANVARNGG